MRAALIGVIGLLSLISACASAAAERCQVHVILFVPADFKPPAGYQERVEQMVAYAEAFLGRELKRWGHDKAVMPFARSAQGKVEVMVVRGKEKAADYKPVAVRMEVMETLRGQKKLDGGRQVWWIMVYAGDPPAKFAGFLGGFGPQIGGWAVCNFNTAPGKIDAKAELGSDFLEKLMLKGMIHELGHGFGLPHIGPLESEGAGNTLMGPTHANFKRVVKNGADRVYLSEAEAALLAVHPAFRGLADERGELPKPKVQDLKYMADPARKRIVVSGRVKAAQRAVYALVADESEARPGEYWTKTYVGKVAADGTFEVVVTEPAAANGTLKTWFVFDSGAQTGDGKARSRESGIPQAYTHNKGEWTFK